jgi:hypothetical protein
MSAAHEPGFLPSSLTPHCVSDITPNFHDCANDAETAIRVNKTADITFFMQEHWIKVVSPSVRYAVPRWLLRVVKLSARSFADSPGASESANNVKGQRGLILFSDKNGEGVRDHHPLGLRCIG